MLSERLTHQYISMRVHSGEVIRRENKFIALLQGGSLHREYYQLKGSIYLNEAASPSIMCFQDGFLPTVLTLIHEIVIIEYLGSKVSVEGLNLEVNEVTLLRCYMFPSPKHPLPTVLICYNEYRKK